MVFPQFSELPECIQYVILLKCDRSSMLTLSCTCKSLAQHRNIRLKPEGLTRYGGAPQGQSFHFKDLSPKLRVGTGSAEFPFRSLRMHDLQGVTNEFWIALAAKYDYYQV